MVKNIVKIQILLFLAAALFWPAAGGAYIGKVKETAPRLANYYLSWEIPNTDVDDLAKWDVLILDMEVQHNSLANLKKLRRLNPDIIILAYVYSEEASVNIGDPAYGALRSELLPQVDDGWWLKNPNGSRVSIWNGTNVLNVTEGASEKGGQHWNDFLPQFIQEKIISTGLWDGVFFDNLWPTLSWLQNGNLDIDRDGQAESKTELDVKWVEGNKKLLSNLRTHIGDSYIIAANSHAFEGYQPYLNGIMLESFPASWEADGTWSGSMKSMSNTKYFKNPKMMVVNANTGNTWAMDNYRKLRFSLGSALLGDAHLSFDYGVNDHSQTWWYDEYEVELGKPVSAPINILDKNNRAYKKGLWRRDFENGIVIVNSTDENKNYVFTDEAFDKIDGVQDRRVNNGARVNMVSLMAQDAIILLGSLSERKAPSAATPAAVPASTAPSAKETAVIRNSVFENGMYVRVFNNEGKQAQNGFFAYDEKYPGGSQVVIADIDNDKTSESLVNQGGSISIYKNNKFLRSFRPFAGAFKGDASLAVSDLNGDGTKEIIVGAGAGGGPMVRVFDQTGRPLIGGFFAYDRGFRGGVNVAVIDLNGDGTKEIITAAGKGGGPHIRIFDKDGRILSGGFFSYDKNFRGGVSLSVGNVDGQGGSEIITGAGVGGSPEVRVWTKEGRLIKNFQAYDSDMRDGLMVTASDLDSNGTDEILAGSLSY